MRIYIAIFVAVCLGFAAPVLAVDTDVIYLSDTNDLNGTDGLSVLYKVEIDTAAMRANLTMLPSGTVPYNHVDALAAEQDGSIIWMINSGPQPAGMTDNVLAAYIVADGSIDEKGQILSSGAGVGDIDQAAMSPSGTLYVTSKSGNKLYTVNKDDATATLVGVIPKSASGGDIAFAQDGTFYMWVGGNGLYELTIGPPITETFVGPAGSGYTGLAVRFNGTGDLIASDGKALAGSSNIQEISQIDASVIANYPMYIGGTLWTSINGYGHGYGDMTTGPLVLCTKTIGYWKNHEWNGATVSINGWSVDEIMGRGFALDGEKPKDGLLWNAKGKTYSMLYAQLIAAKLNTNDSVAVQAIVDAEDFLLNKDFNAVVSRSYKKAYSALVERLTMFNEMYHCEDDTEPVPY